MLKYEIIILQKHTILRCLSLKESLYFQGDVLSICAPNGELGTVLLQKRQIVKGGGVGGGFLREILSYTCQCNYLLSRVHGLLSPE